MIYSGFPEKINGDFDFTQTGGEFPSYWFDEDEEDYSFEFRPYKNIKYLKNEKKRWVFMNFKDAMNFLRNYYIDPISMDRVIRRDNFIKLKDDSFILMSSYDTFPDEYFDYYIYDEDLNKQYITYLFGADPFIEEIYILCSKGKIKTQMRYINESDNKSYAREDYYKLDDDDEELGEYDLKEVYHNESIYKKKIYAFNVESFLDSQVISYYEFKEKELQIRKKELELFKEIKERRKRGKRG